MHLHALELGRFTWPGPWLARGLNFVASAAALGFKERFTIYLISPPHKPVWTLEHVICSQVESGGKRRWRRDGNGGSRTHV